MVDTPISFSAIIDDDQEDGCSDDYEDDWNSR